MSDGIPTITAMLDMSAGNESVGEEWIETKVLDRSDTIEDVMEWAAKRKHGSHAKPFDGSGHYIAFNVRLSINQE